jgi:hypothetical protein
VKSDNDELLPALRYWVKEDQEKLRKEGWVLKLDDSRADWKKGSLSLAIDGDDRLGLLTVWSTGEAELECAEIATGNVRREHRELASPPDLQGALQDLMKWLNADNPKRRRRYWRARHPKTG